MNYTKRLANYLRQRPNESSAPELTHLTPAQRRRLRHKLRHNKAVALRKRRATLARKKAEKEESNAMQDSSERADG